MKQISNSNSALIPITTKEQKSNAIQQKENEIRRSVENKAESVAQEFEAMFLDMMLKSMRQTTSPEDESNARNIYTSMLDTEYSKQMAQNRSFGIKEIILKWIEQNSRQPKEAENQSNSPIEGSKPILQDIRARMAAESYVLQSKLSTK